MNSKLLERTEDERIARSRTSSPHANNITRRHSPAGLIGFRRVKAKRFANIKSAAVTQVIEHVARTSDLDPVGELHADQIAELAGTVTKEMMHVFIDRVQAPVSVRLRDVEERARVADPLAMARQRGAQTKRGLLEAEGGTLSGAEVAELLGLSRQAVDVRRKKGTLVGLSQEIRGLKGIAIPTHIAIPERAVDRPTASITDDRVLSRMDEMVEELLYFAAQLRQPHLAPNIPARMPRSQP